MSAINPDTFERLLQSRLHRQTCLEPDTLCDYVLDLLAGDELAAVQTHLGTCITCTQEVAWVRVAFQENRAEQVQPVDQNTLNKRPAHILLGTQADLPSLGERIRRLVGQLVPAQPQLALRGATDSRTWQSVFDGGQMFVEIEPGKDGTHLTGQVLFEAADDSWEGALAQVRQRGTVLTIAVLDDLGEFACDVKLMDDMPITIEITSLSGDHLVVQSTTLER